MSFTFIFSLIFSISLIAEDTELPKVKINQTKINIAQIKPEIVQIISKNQIQSGFKNLTHLLSHVAGIRINNSGGYGQNAIVLVRGSKSQHIQFFIDGIPITTGISNNVNIGKISLAGIEKIEIYRSYVPSQLQSGNLGAAINIITNKTGQNKTYIYSKTQLGSFSTFKQTGELLKNTKNHNFSLSTEFVSAKNNFKFHNDRGTPFNANDDSIDKKSNNGFSNFHLSGNLSLKNKKYTQSFSLKNNIGEQKIGGPQNTIITEAKNNFNEIDFNYSAKNNKNKTSLDWLAIIHLSHHKNIFSDPLAEVGFSKNHINNETNKADLQFFIKYNFSDSFFASSSTYYSKLNSKKKDSIQLENSYWKRDLLNSNLESSFSYNNTQIKLKAQWQYLNDKAYLINRENNELNSFDTHISFLYMPNEKSLLKLNVGKNTRAPNLFELFGDKGLTVGNKNLTTESSWYGEIYFQWQTKRNNWSISNNSSGYFKLIDNLITFQQISAGLSRPKNIDESQIFGGETQLQLSWKDLIEGNINYAYTYAINDSSLGFVNEKFIPGIPQHHINANISIKFKNLSLTYTTQLLTKEYLDELNLIEKNSRVLHDLLLIITYKNMTFEMEVKNIADKQYEDFINYPLPGRSYWFGLAINF